jgi:hypothetical protein
MFLWSPYSFLISRIFFEDGRKGTAWVNEAQEGEENLEAVVKYKIKNK